MTTPSTAIPDREAWLTELGALILDDLLLPLAGMDEARPWRVSVGFPSGKSARKAEGQCFASSHSADGHCEVFISPRMDCPERMAAVLTHELIHVLDDCASGHKGFFSRVARQAGLQRPLTVTHPTLDLAAQLRSYLDLLPPLPHAALQLDTVPKQRTRMIKVECPMCGFLFRSTRKHLDQLTDTSPCPACTLPYLQIAD